MGRQVKGGSVDERVLRLLLERYPITAQEVALALRLRPGETDLVLARLARQGLVTLESPGGKTYVALTGAGIQFLGASSSDVAKARRGKLPPAPPRPDDDPAFQ